MNYEILINLSDELVESKLNLKSAYDKIISINLNSDPIKLKDYIGKKFLKMILKQSWISKTNTLHHSNTRNSFNPYQQQLLLKEVKKNGAKTA